MISYKEILARTFDRSHLRRNLLIGVGIITLLGVVLFNGTIQSLLNRPFGSRASIDDDDLQKVWEAIRPDDGVKAAHSKMVLIQKDGRAWIYVAGGAAVTDNLPAGRKQTEILKTVKRYEVDAQTGKPVSGAKWEPMPDMNFGRMEFGFVEQGEYLYAIAGDMHYPPAEAFNSQTESPLIYSTIERLKLNDPTATWEIFAKLGGINYYPEVAATSNGIHVVGGVYGYPFPPLTSDPGLADNLLNDVVNQDGDTKWNIVANLPTIGEPGVKIPRGATNTTITTGGGTTTGGTTGGSTGGTTNNGETTSGNTTGGPIQLNDASLVIGPKVLGDVEIFQSPIRIQIINPPSDPNFVWDGNSKQNVQWLDTYPEEASYSIHWRPASSASWQTLATNVPEGDVFTTHEITVPDITTNTAEIRVCKTGTVCTDDTTQDTDVVSPIRIRSPRAVVITKPLSAPDLRAGTSTQITWIEKYHVDDHYYSIWWREVPGSWQYIKNIGPGGNATTWTVPAHDGQAQVMVCREGSLGGRNECGGGANGDISETFNITGDVAISRMHPDSSSILYVGRQENITWDTQYSQTGTATISWTPNYNPSSPNWQTLATNAPYSDWHGTFAWTVPNQLTTTARFRICLNNTTVCRISSANSEIRVAPAQFIFTSPTQGQKLQAGTNHTITWTTDFGGSMDLWLSINGEAATKLNSSSFSATILQYTWPVTYTPTTQAQFIARQGGSTVELGRSSLFTIEIGEIVSDKLSQALLSGEFVTTVGAHYFIGISSNGNYNQSTTKIGELGSDYYGTTNLSERWELGKVAHIGHLRFYITDDSKVIPVPQGRYGHKLVFNNNSYYVFGGASWAKELKIKPANSNEESFKTFWVIDNTNHPVYTLEETGGSTFSFKYGKPNYEFVGNIAYRWDGNRWLGVNGIGTKNYSGQTLDNGYSFKLYDGINPTGPKGRAFFGLANTSGSNFVAVGGLQNQTVTTFSGERSYETHFAFPYDYFRIPVMAVGTTELFDGSKWNNEQPYENALFNIQSVSLGGGGLFYSGQPTFQNLLRSSLTIDPHVPDYTQEFTSQSKIYKEVPSGDVSTPRWYAMPDMNAVVEDPVLSYVVVTPGSAVIKNELNASKTYAATAYDQNGNPMSGVTFTWKIIDELAIGNRHSISPEGVFTYNYRPEEIDNKTYYGDIEVTAKYNNQTVKSAADLWVYTETEPEHLYAYTRVTPLSVQVPIKGSKTLVARAYDRYGAEITGGTFNWTVQPAAGTLNVNTGARVIFTGSENAGYESANAIQVTHTAAQAPTNVRVAIRTSLAGGSPALFAATSSGVIGGGDNRLTTAYHYGGFESDILRYVGAFGNEPDPRDQLTISLTLIPSAVSPDDADFSMATVRVVNGLGEPVSELNGERLSTTVKSTRNTSAATDIVRDQGGYRTNKLERAIRLGEPLEGSDTMSYIGEDGTARFKIFSKTTHPGVTIFAPVELGGRMSVGYKIATLIVENKPGIPSQKNSTIVAEPNPVAADDATTSLVTVTLKDYAGTPVVGYHVAITSDRNSGGGSIDTITNNAPGSYVTNSQGQATFRIKSAVRGEALIRAKYGSSAEELLNNPRDLSSTLKLKFQGFITGLIPDRAKQGQKLPSLTANGSQTNWVEGSTKVSFAKPQVVDFDRSAGVTILADGSTPVKYAVLSPQHKGKKVTLTISDSTMAAFWPEFTTSVTRTLDSNGRGEFYVQPTTKTGPITINAQIEGIGAPSSKLMIVATDPRLHAYEIDLYANPTLLEAGNASSAIRAGLYQYGPEGRTLITTPIEFQFYKDDLGTFNPSTGRVTSENGIAPISYTRDAKSGTVHIFAVAKFGSYTIADYITVHKVSSNEGITFNPSFRLTGDPQGQQTLTILSTAPDKIDAVTIADNAEVGQWTFITENTTGTETEAYSYPFTVLSKDFIGGPRITDINPSQGFRGTQNVTLTLRGSDTNFANHSMVNFTSLSGNSAGITVVEGSKSAPDPQTLTLKVNIANDATAGFWNISVSTDLGQRGIELAEFNGSNDEDFLVTTQSNYIIDVLPNPNVLPRDGRAKSTINAFVGKLDPLSGKITPVKNAEVKFAFVGSDGGKLDPLTDGPGSNGRKTNSDGIATTNYTTDAGLDDDDVKISATVVIEGVTLSNYGVVIKKVSDNDNVVLTATPNSHPLTGGTSTLEVIVKDSKGNFAKPGTPVEFIIQGVGTIVPIRTAVEGNEGKATAIYSVGTQSLAQTVHLFAKATIDGDGIVISNEELISIGLDSSKYLVTISASPTSINAGGTQASNVTAKIVYKDGNNQTPVANWPVSFAISRGGVGDYLTVINGKTNASGEITSKLFAGLIPGTTTVVAKPMALNWAEVGITKTVDETISAAHSTISAVPKYVPADNTAFTVITVTLKNNRYVPLANKSVTLTSSLGAISPSDTVTTNADGIAKFNIKSGTTGTANVSAVADGVTLTTQAIFVPVGELVPLDLTVIVPLQANSYDRLVKLFLRQPVAGQLPIVDEIYKTNISDQVLELPTLYVKPSTEYKFWAKGKNHLARVKPVTATSQNVSVNFTGTHRGQQVGLLIADIAGNSESLFRDNAINAVDFAAFALNWFKSSYLADFNSDGTVTIIDYVYWLNNYGSGDPLP